jgi:HTH-type transcriptional regulator/antitoxin HigA
MHIITRTRLTEFGARYADARQPLLDWERVIRRKRYRDTAEVKSDFPSVDFIGKGRAVFNICGNDYRLVVKMDFRRRGLVLVPTRDTMATAMALDFSKPHVLRNAREFKAAVAELDHLADADPKRGTEAYDRLEFLAVLIEAYENEHNPIDERKGTPQSVVAFMLEQKGMTRADLAALIGGKARVSEFFSGKRRLSIEQVRALRDELGIPADLLIA